MSTKVKELMTENPVLVDPNMTLEKAAKQMRDIDCGVLPVGTEQKLKGMITDRDIVIRAVARAKDVSREQVRDYMTEEVFSCDEDDTLEEAADIMRAHKVSRLIVKDKAGGVCGILTFGCIFRKDEDSDEIANVVRHATRHAA